MKSTNILIIATLAIASCGTSCRKDKDIYEEVLFEFEIPLNITPGIDTVKVGQELMLIADFSDSLFDVYSQKKYYLPKFDLKIVAVIKKLINPIFDIVDQPGATNKFTYTTTIGWLSNFSETFADVNWLYENHRYKLTTKLITQETGVFIVRFYHSTGTKGSTSLPQELAPNEPGVKRFPLMRHMRPIFNDGNTHFNIYKDNCKERDSNEATNWVEGRGTYTFVVK